MNILIDIVTIYSEMILIYFFVISFIYIALILVSSKELKNFIRIIKNEVTIISNYTKPISIVVPAYNEEETIIDNITSLLDLNYPEFEVIVINDGSNDNTLAKIINYFKLREIDLEINMQVNCKEIRGVYGSFEIPNLVVVDKLNGGKADALNA